MSHVCWLGGFLNEIVICGEAFYFMGGVDICVLCNF